MNLFNLVMIICIIAFGHSFAQEAEEMGKMVLTTKSYDELQSACNSVLVLDTQLQRGSMGIGGVMRFSAKFELLKRHPSIAHIGLFWVSLKQTQNNDNMVRAPFLQTRYRYLFLFDYYLKRLKYAAYTYQSIEACPVHQYAHQHGQSNCLGTLETYQLSKYTELSYINNGLSLRSFPISLESKPVPLNEQCRMKGVSV
ncbi:MAG: hypothetical protein JKY52_12970 [Flavobacteriales bacterium]|nr:hypothetical protein [Flavobacteriales bacterium]